MKILSLEAFINGRGAKQNTLGRNLNANQEQVAALAPQSVGGK